VVHTKIKIWLFMWTTTFFQTFLSFLDMHANNVKASPERKERWWRRSKRRCRRAAAAVELRYWAHAAILCRPNL